MSNEPATASAAHSSSVAHTILRLFCRDLDALPEAEQAVRLTRFDHILRKTAHFCIYGTLGALLLLYSLCFAAKPHLHALRSEAVAALYAASDELHQALVPGRGPAVTDVLLDSAGALFGILCIAAFLCAVKNHIQKAHT